MAASSTPSWYSEKDWSWCPPPRGPTGRRESTARALERLAEEDAEAARLVELRFFVGMGHQEAASIMGITRREADDTWAFARAWLLAEIQKESRANGGEKLP